MIVYSQPSVHQWSQTGHVGYLTNWASLDRVTDTMVLVPRDGEATFSLPALDFMLDQIEPVSWMEDIRMVASPDPRAIAAAFTTEATRGEAAPAVNTFGQEAYEILKATGSAGRPIAISGMEAMSIALYRDIETSIPDGIADTIDIVAEPALHQNSRRNKSPQEGWLQSPTGPTRPWSDVLEDGMLGYELMAELDRSARAGGGDMVYHCIHWAPNGELERGHLSIKPMDQPLRAGDYINVNAYVVYKGYWIQSDRWGTIGPKFEGSAAGDLRRKTCPFRTRFFQRFGPDSSYLRCSTCRIAPRKNSGMKYRADASAMARGSTTRRSRSSWKAATGFCSPETFSYCILAWEFPAPTSL